MREDDESAFLDTSGSLTVLSPEDQPSIRERTWIGMEPSLYMRYSFFSSSS
jgi:hypothetical protein